MKISVESKECELCQGLIDNLPKISKSIVRKLHDYEFDTFLVGASLPQLLLDKEDEIRSRFKIRGAEAIRTEITRKITREIISQMGKTIDYARPDITILASLETGEHVITPRSIWLMARYRKTIRGLAQRSSTCNVCNGLGCAACNYQGSTQSSIQSILSLFFAKKFRADGCSFIWIGSEDEQSIVDGSGRPFYVEIHRPRKRKIPKTLFKHVAVSAGLALTSVEALQSRPKLIPQFNMKCIAYLSKAAELQQDSNIDVEPKLLKEDIESKFRDLIVQVRVSRKFRIVSRQVRFVKVMENQKDHPYVLEIDCDGGIPIRKLVSGNDDTVFPNLSPYISGYTIDPDMPFDIEDITLVEAHSQRIISSKRNGRHGSYERRAEDSSIAVDDTEEEISADVMC